MEALSSNITEAVMTETLSMKWLKKDAEYKEADRMKIEEARKQKNMSRKELSEWLEIPYRTLTNWENGERSCPDYIEKLIVEKILRDK